MNHQTSSVILGVGLVSNPDLGFELANLSGQSTGLGRRVSRTLESGLVALGFESDLSEFNWTNDQNKVASLEWMGPRILAFDSALRELGRSQTVWPFGFPCLFSSWKQMDVILQPHLATIKRFLQRYQDHQEYNLLIYQSPPLKVDQPPSTIDNGLSYLKLRQQQAKQVEIQKTVYKKFAEDMKIYLQTEAYDWQEKPVSTLLSHQKVNNHIVIAAPSQDIGAIEVKAKLLAESVGIKISVTGPWPLMSFIERIEVQGVKQQTSDESFASEDL